MHACVYVCASAISLSIHGVPKDTYQNEQAFIQQLPECPFSLSGPAIFGLPRTSIIQNWH